MKQQYLVEKLDVKTHCRESFDCGVEFLNLYLKERANQEQKKWLNITYVAISSLAKNPPIIGYYTLSNSAIKLAVMKQEFKRDIPPTYDIPSIKIGRLAVDKEHVGKGIGSLLLKDACMRVIDIAALSGVLGVEVVAKNKIVADFYKKFGFVELSETVNTLFLPTATILNAVS